MEHFPISNYGGQNSPVGLLAFLSDCKKRAKELDVPQLVNISLDVFHIDPLAILEAVYEPQNQHFFLENPAMENSIAAIETVLQKTASGPERFQKIKNWAGKLLESTLYTGNTDSPYCGIHFFCSFNFFDEVWIETLCAAILACCAGIRWTACIAFTCANFRTSATADTRCCLDAAAGDFGD